jgi:hypothetical protein
MESKVFSMCTIDDNFPVLAKDIAKATRVHPVLSKVHQYTMNGWPDNEQ